MDSEKIEEALHQYLMAHKITLATAESCTGGALAARFVAQRGASKYFQGSIVAYANSVKEKMLKVSSQTIAAKGAVSCEVTEEMAMGAAENLDAMCSVAVSGILGPDGGTSDAPVGTICATIFLKGHLLHSWKMSFTGNRETILKKTIHNILCELLLYLRKT